MRDLSLHLMDIIQNSITAGAGRISVKLRLDEGMLSMTVGDDGCGMDAEILSRVTDPFCTTRTTRRVGLGIPLLKEAAERASGGFRITSEKGSGTTVEAIFDAGSIDRPVLGDMAGTIAGSILARPETELVLEAESSGRIFRLDTSEIRDRLGEVPINGFEVLNWISEYVNEGITAIFGGVLDEIDSGAGRDKEEDS